MNKLQGTITAVVKSDALTKINILCANSNLIAFAIDSDYNPNDIGREVIVLFKESEVSIAKDFIGEISLQNRFTCKIQNIQKGELLAQLTLSFFENRIDSIISISSVKRMNLQIGDNVIALVKSTEMILVGINDE